MSKRYDELFGEIVSILRRDWAGKDRLSERFDPRYYNTAVGQAWHDDKLDELLFLRYMSQMLAVIGDRHLRIRLRPSDRYTPWSPGFFARRYEDTLVVTSVSGETGLCAGDRITAINGGSPSHHQRIFQKNFLFSDQPEREDWRGLLKMADYIDVTHPDGRTEQLPLRHCPTEPPAAMAVHESTDGLIFDLRNAQALGSHDAEALLSAICPEGTPLSSLYPSDVYINCTRLNCLILSAACQGVPEAEAYAAELRAKMGQGFVLEADESEPIRIGCAHPRKAVVLIDTWTRDDAEALALAAARAGARLLGRPTLGTLDLCGDVHYELDERFTLTWPTAILRQAQEGRPIGPVQPDEYIPFTPAECESDLLMQRAEVLLSDRKTKIN